MPNVRKTLVRKFRLMATKNAFALPCPPIMLCPIDAREETLHNYTLFVSVTQKKVIYGLINSEMLQNQFCFTFSDNWFYAYHHRMVQN